MTILEMRLAIHKAIDNVPENSLPEILDYINSVQNTDVDKKRLDDFIDRVFKEDDNLLRRLAE